MEGIEFDAASPPPHDPAVEDDFCCSILARFAGSSQDDHQHLCAVVGAMSQELKDQCLPRTPIAYFGATCSSLDKLLSASPGPDPQGHVVESLMTLLCLLLPKVSASVVRKRSQYVSELVLRVVRGGCLPPGAVGSGLKCVSHLLNVSKDANWSSVAQLYGVLLGFVTESHPKIRRQSHLCLRDVLRSFHGTPAVVPASEGVTSMFERFLLLAGGSKGDATEGSRGAQEVLYVLDSLKECLPFMSLKYTSNTLKYFKTLLELRQPLVTRRITDGLSALCLYPTSEVSPEALLDLLCSLAHLVSASETSVDGMTFTARLLDAGMRKVYSLNRQICVVKLPLIFNALREILPSEHEEAIFASAETFKRLIDYCIDEDLINQGVEQIKIHANAESRKSGPTCIERICVTIESLLDYRFSAVWDVAFQIISATLKKLGNNASYLLRGMLKSLGDLQKLPDEDFPYRKQLHECVGLAVVALGPEMFLSLLPLNLESDDLSEVNVWLFPVLKQYTVGAHLSYFMDSVLDSVGLIKQKARKLELEGRVFSARSADALVYSLWSLLPSFCNYAVDTAESLKYLEKALCRALREEPDVRGVICSSLQLLIDQNKRVLNENDESSGTEFGISAEKAVSHYTLQVATDNLSVLRSSAREFLSVLSGIFLNSKKDDGGCLQSTIAALSSVADKAVISRLYKSTMQKLLKVTLEAGKVRNSRKPNSMGSDDLSNESSPSVLRGKLFDLAASLLPGLNVAEVDVLFKAIQPALQDADSVIQKKSYKVLSVMLKNDERFLSLKLEELMKLMVEVLPTCHFSAKRHRLECLYFLIVHLSKDGSDKTKPEIVCSFLTEIILALKEANKKTRNRAYDILVEIGHACGDEEKGGRKEDLLHFFNMVAGGLAGETPHMISAAAKGLARLAYEFTDLVSTAFNVLPSTFLLLQRKNREIIKANLGLLKVLVAKSQVDWLQMHLGSMVEGLLKWQDNTKNHFKSKVKVLLEMLVKKCGLDAVKAVMPEEHMKLLTNIRKIKERKERKHASNSEESRSHLSKATTSRWNHTKIFSDSGDEESTDGETDYMDGETNIGRRSRDSALLKLKATSLRSKKSHRSAKSLPEDLIDQLEDGPLDLLDRQKMRSALRGSQQGKRKAESDDDLEIDSEGRLVIHEGEGSTKSSAAHPDSDSRSEAGGYLSMDSSRKTQKRRKTSQSGWAYTGNEYASKKARGDLKRKDKLEPYAYWPLDRKMMSRRPEHRAAARRGMASVVKMTKMLEGKSASSALSLKSTKFKKKGNKAGKKKGK
ncbi:RRP12-like protein isoform X2 [Rhodamnia argentea]|uniref:RRP12-like protein isoform X2 n=1 Tax=Rhodamnia argentea TaxID=178133 RepID=A0A8B8P768_9MYRT|nr:RRP12-like protein isoform X2 [Rhodamnia argentea]